ncbi:hypothetical protein [Nostoc sp.]|uniref:hypothetical protein n=1 Tax=Nostoc sp. TaxID=1180 RepID=UPI002FFC3D59
MAIRKRHLNSNSSRRTTGVGSFQRLKIRLYHLADFSCTVTTWDEQYTVIIDHLKPLNFFTQRSPEYVLQELV